ncbi:MAG: LPXTG cell wall anchor domain-containing protein [Acidimicrobiales bacterium]|nr:LPXTG cell wall anchor domain-containing protein [Acidimicrobiales bacterium]
MVLMALAAVALMAVPAAAQYPGIVVQPGRVTVDGTVTVTGKGCAPGETVTITLNQPGETTGGTVVATVTTDAEGNFSASFNVPAGTQPGMYDVVSTCGDLVQSQPIEVLANDVTNTGGTGTGSGVGSGNLPRTGSNLNGVGLVGAGLLVVGGLFLLVSRKRRSAEAA